MSVGQNQLLEMLNISRTTLWRMIKRDEFPAPNRDNPRKLIWCLLEVENHLKQLNCSSVISKGLCRPNYRATLT